MGDNPKNKNSKRALSSEVRAHFAFEKAISIPEYRRRSAIPSCIYHYTDASGVLGILQKQAIRLWFTRQDCLNDASEGLDITEHYTKVCSQLLSENLINQTTYEEICLITANDKIPIVYNRRAHMPSPPIPQDDSAHDPPPSEVGSLLTNTYLCCFSSGNDLLPMWNYYSNGHQYSGYCIGFDSKIASLPKEYFNNSSGQILDGYKIVFAPVIYDEKQKEQELRKRILTIVKYCSIFHANLSHSIESMLNSLHYLFKNPAFSHEQEVRLILSLADGVNKIDQSRLPSIEYRIRNGVVIPYVVIDIYHANYIVKEIKIGPLIEAEIAKKNMQLALNARNYHPDISKSGIPIRY